MSELTMALLIVMQAIALAGLITLFVGSYDA